MQYVVTAVTRKLILGVGVIQVEKEGKGTPCPGRETGTWYIVCWYNWGFETEWGPARN